MSGQNPIINGATSKSISPLEKWVLMRYLPSVGQQINLEACFEPTITSTSHTTLLFHLAKYQVIKVFYVDRRCNYLSLIDPN